MRRAGPERTLRRAVAGLSRFHPEDLAMILDALEPGERAEIDRLLAELSGRPIPRQADEADPEPAWTYQGVSPWLRARMDLDGEPAKAGADFFLVTEAARSALLAAAQPFKVARSGCGEGGSLVGRLWGKLSGARP